MKLRKPWMIKLAGWLGAGALRLWMSTLRCKTDSRGQHTDPWDPTLQERYIYALWHENLLFLPKLTTVTKIAALISQSDDGELIATIGQSYGLLTVRGSSKHGGMEAMEEVIQMGKRAHLLVAPDGPLGPRREVKRGLPYLASWTGMRVVPLGIGFTGAWRVKSWDRMAVPKPFSTMTVVAGPVVHVPSGIGKSGMEHYRRLIEQSIMAATEAAEAWAEGKTINIDWPNVSAPAA